MYADILYWSTYWSSLLPIWVSSEDISFDNYGLQNSEIIVEYFNPFDFWSIEYNSFDIPQDDWKWFLSKFYREKQITIKWIIKKNTQLELETKITEFKKNLTWNEKILKYKTADGIYRQIKTTCSNLKFDKNFFNITWIPFEITFENNEPFWSNSTPSVSFYETIISSPLLEEITNNWIHKSKPQIYFFFNTATSVTSISVLINSRTITWNWTIVSWDLLVFDSLNQVVEKNNITQDYTWTFPFLNSWSNPITYTINWTFSCDISNLYKLNY